MSKKIGYQNDFYLKNKQRPNVYTNKNINDGHKSVECFSLPKPLSSSQPYFSPHIIARGYLRQKSIQQKNRAPMKTGKMQISNNQNIQIYFDRNQYERKSKSPRGQAKNHSESTQKNIYLSKNIGTSYGKGKFKANYKNLFQNYQYQSQRSNKQEAKKDLYTKYKRKQAFKASGKGERLFSQQNQLHGSPGKNPYAAVNEDNVFRSKSNSRKLLHRFQWKPTTQFIKRVQQ